MSVLLNQHKKAQAVFNFPFVEYTKHLETQKVALLVLGLTLSAGCLTAKEKIEIACDGKGTYLLLSLRRIIYTSDGQTNIIPLLDYLTSKIMGKPIVVEEKKTAQSYDVSYEGRLYQITPVERLHTFSRMTCCVRARMLVYEVSDMDRKATTVVASKVASPRDIARQAHLSLSSHFS